MGSDNCGDHLHKFHPSHQLFLNRKYLREPEIPPRKLLSRRPSGEPEMPPPPHMESPTKMEDTQFQKFLPYNNSDDDDDDPYSSDNFRMFEFKVRRCTRSRSHDWTDCPFAHPGEKARRRDPRKYHYSGSVCAEFRKGSCVRGDNCEFAHGVFECWLHPTRYRTEACKDGKNCKRKVCFFAHTPRQLRVLPPDCHDSNNNSPMNSPNMNHCCACCHSPNSTLMAISHMSPPVSPATAKSPFSRFGGPENCGIMDQFEQNPNSMADLVSSLESMNLNVTNAAYSHHMKIPAMVDLNFNVNNLSADPPTPTPSKLLTAGGSAATTKYYNDSGLPGIDLGWVNDLLT